MAKPIRALAMDAVKRAVPQLRRDFDEYNRCARGVGPALCRKPIPLNRLEIQ
jgi:hypothetical protein